MAFPVSFNILDLQAPCGFKVVLDQNGHCILEAITHGPSVHRPNNIFKYVLYLLEKQFYRNFDFRSVIRFAAVAGAPDFSTWKELPLEYSESVALALYYLNTVHKRYSQVCANLVKFVYHNHDVLDRKDTRVEDLMKFFQENKETVFPEYLQSL